jgi:TonB family protein
MSKKPLSLFLIINFFFLIAKAQVDIHYNMKSYGLSEVPVLYKDSADFFRVIQPLDKSDKLFPVNDYYKNGSPKMIGKSISPGPNIQLQGVNVEFFPNGKKKSERNFKDGKLVGNITMYFPSGQIYIIGKYDKNNKLIILECRDSIGKVLTINGNGSCIRYNEDFKDVYAEGNIVNGLEDGEWRGKMHDSITFTCFYNAGIIKKGTSHNNRGKEYTFTDLKLWPKFKGGMDGFYGFLAHNLRYPAPAKDFNVEGVVFVSFIVDETGKLSDFKIVRGIGSGCDEEVIRVMKLSPPWIPGAELGMPVKTLFIVPIRFSLAYNN